MKIGETQSLDRETCTYLVQAFLLAQDWQLVEAGDLGLTIWHALRNAGLVGQAAVKAVQREAWLRYGVILHDCCRQPDHPSHQRAWKEVDHWLRKQVPRLTADPREQEEILQEALISLQKQLQQSALDTPRAWLAYTTQTLRKRQIDLHRRRTAAKRGDDQTVSLVELTREESNWEELIPASAGRTPEAEVADSELRQQLERFFRQHLPTQLQQDILIAYFLDGLEPKEIAGLMGKPAHQIRAAKARAMQKLRDLSEKDRQQLAHLLGQGDEGGSHDS